MLIETDTSWGCSVIRGIANFAERHARWHLLLDPRDHEHRSALPDGWRGDGVIARITTRLQVDQISSLPVPLVNVGDLFEEIPNTPSVSTDEVALSA
ncbi:MAG: hypothetical protein KDA37_04440, partial [Planctomycetales bacterium]|nr:hypothetical protein [Planctomycetales bacterium]